MASFPRTMVGGVSLSRLIIGTNWLLGYSHCTPAKDKYIKEVIRERKAIADILEVFFRAGVDTIMAPFDNAPLHDALKDAQDRTGVKGILISTPSLPVTAATPSQGFDIGEVERILDATAAQGAVFCMPHQCTTDALTDRCSREVRRMADIIPLIRQRGMIPGLSTHMPEAIVYADETKLDVETYISIYNSAGFLMQLEVDWVAKLIQQAQHPVMTIKPLAAGQLRPFQGLNFVWNTIRPCDMVTIGTMSPDEAREVIDMSLGILAHQPADIKLQETRSKASVKAVG
ncbi:MAG: hypothetical protein WCJ56_06005 [bacterium]